MTSRIADYALLGDTRTAALVSRDGSIDWMCVPRFDSGSCFSALLGAPDHGRWLLTPTAAASVERRYRDGTLVLDTHVRTASGEVLVTDCLAVGTDHPVIVRTVLGLSGTVRMRTELLVRFDYGAAVPWVRGAGTDRLVAVAGPDGVVLTSPVPLEGGDAWSGELDVHAGEEAGFLLAYFPAEEDPPAPGEPGALVESTRRWWSDWAATGSVEGPWEDAVRRSVVTLKALSYAPTGGIVAAPTTSLPEVGGGSRNWDYRACWLRDATFTLYALLACGYDDEARAWREWLLRAVAGRPEDLQIMYGLHGERRLPEWEVGWLPGYRGSTPVRVGNDASRQFQLDVYGEVLDVLHLTRRLGEPLPDEADGWLLQRRMLDVLESAWTRPDASLWEVRGEQQHFTISKIMAWVAFDRAVKGVEQFGLGGPVERWRRTAARIHGDVCRHGFDPQVGAFVQSYGSTRLDAALLLAPEVGFLPADDPRIVGTVAAIERDLMVDGLVLRYRPDSELDGQAGTEGAFLPCSFWLADALILQGRRDEAVQLFERLLALRNDVGLLSEEADPATGELLGNFPQALSHVALVNTAHNLAGAGPAHDRSEASRPPRRP